MTRLRRSLLTAAALVAAGGGVAACGEQGIDVPPDQRASAELFVDRCSGCHTLSVTGTEGSTTDITSREYKDGPNFDQRKVTPDCVLYAIRNGGFSSGPMPQNIVVGPQAQELAEFVARNSGGDVEEIPGQPPVDTDCPAG